jgi:mono/diheme cytochrome c family protein
MNFRAFSIGISAALLALACGSSDDNGANEPTDIPKPPKATETCADNEFLAGCPPPNDDPGPGAGPAAPVDKPVAGPTEEDPNKVAKALAENVLLTECGGCHGTNLSITEAKGGGFNFINDIDQLVDKGYIKPLDPEGSRIIQRMRKGEMPPSSQGFAPVADANIEIVAAYIKNPQFWPTVPPQADCSKTGQEFGFDPLFAAVAQDLQGEDADDQVNFRYIALTNRFTAGVCADTALDTDRQALIKMVNMLSVEARVVAPEEVNKDRTIYRIDLRKYGWDRPISVNGVAFTDVWEAIAANNAYAVQFTGDDADDAIEDSGTNFPVMLADSMLDAATIGNLYYAIIDVDVNATIDDFILNVLDIDVQADLDESDLVRAGTTKSRISRQDRVVERHDIGVRQGAFWQSFDFEDDQNESIFEDPFAFNEGGREAIFSLENGLLGFIIADDAGAILEDSDILLDTAQNNFRAVTSVSCSGCHSTGFIPVVDEVKELSLDNRIALGLNNDEVEQLEDVYPDPTEFAAIVADDSSAYQRSLDNLKLPTRGGDPVSSVFLRFDRDMNLKDAAGDLGVTPDLLDSTLGELNPVLRVLDRGVIDRDDFTKFYVDSLCILSISNDNAPLADVCAAADALVNP